MAGFVYKVGEIRPNQLITTFGPGAIMDAVKDSVTVLDTNYWTHKGKKISDGRLASYLGVNCFYMPRTSKGFDLPVCSFPYVHVCPNPKCGRIFDVRDNFDAEKFARFGATCPSCNKPAYPSRFIVTCEQGHMDDFPYRLWVHRGKTDCKASMKMFSTGNTSTLADMWIQCDCGAKRSMSGATQKDEINKLCSCSGNFPFRPNSKKDRNCKCQVTPSQRGASNVYFPVIRSAISIPPWIDPIFNLIDEHMRIIEAFEQVRGADGITDAYNLYFSAFPREEFDAALKKRRENIKEFNEIKQMEYNAITHHNDPVYQRNKKHFLAEEDPLPEELKPYFSRIIRITRLREVMVLLGHTRVSAPDPDTDADKQPNIVYLHKGKDEKWLPAAEIHGEGIFIEFNKDSIEKWINASGVKELSNLYERSYNEYCESRQWSVNLPRNAKYVMMHTFAHLLIKEMAMFSGYSSSSIKERIYCSDKMSGILLYTGSSDKEGSLGGLVELGEVSKIIKLMTSAFENALICTNDPECSSHVPNGDAINGSACHSCCMISETACENGNRMLDRGLVVPLENKERNSYFGELVVKLCQLET